MDKLMDTVRMSQANLRALANPATGHGLYFWEWCSCSLISLCFRQMLMYLFQL